MRPILFRFGDVDVWSHPVFAFLGIAVAMYFTWRSAQREKRWDQRFLFIVAGGLIGAALLAKFGLSLRYFQLADEPTLDGLLRYSGRTVLGGLAGAYFGVVLTKKLIGYPYATGDIFAPGVALGMGVGRIGCFLSERPGAVTSLPWGMTVTPDVAALVPQCPACVAGDAMHPSFLYEVGFDFAAAWVLFRVARSRQLPRPWMVEGDVFRLFLLAYAVFRVAVEFVRGSPAMAFGLSGSQLFALVSALVLGAYFARRHRAAGATRAAPA